MKSVGELQTMLAWAEDRALLRSTPMPTQGPRPSQSQAYLGSALSRRSKHESSGIVQPPPQTFAARCRDIQATMPFTIQLCQSDEIPFHGEPRHCFFSKRVRHTPRGIDALRTLIYRIAKPFNERASGLPLKAVHSPACP